MFLNLTQSHKNPAGQQHALLHERKNGANRAAGLSIEPSKQQTGLPKKKKQPTGTTTRGHCQLLEKVFATLKSLTIWPV
jgi:hypothetical protein